jgi:glutamate-ammonia-ligase adenylyltransferase
MAALDRLIAASPDPAAAANRLERLRSEPGVRHAIDALGPEQLRLLVHVVALSNFLFHFLLRHPAAIGLTGSMQPEAAPASPDVAALRLFKYRELYRLTTLDVGGSVPYPQILSGLTALAEACLRGALRISAGETDAEFLERHLAVIALGKLGAGEINYSSDVDLLFVSSNHGEARMDIEVYQERLQRALRRFTRLLEEQTAEGFLYRVDLNLRPWGRSGPLFMAIDDTEHYYEASSDAWERFAWLRARPVAGALALGREMVSRLQPFVFRRSLGADDLERFVGMKHELSRMRRRRGHWNVKVGEGGIRDIEFFVQTLQIVNAARVDGLQSSSTIDTLKGLAAAELITPAEALEAEASYLFLRRLENRLQMQDEQQTHELPDHPARRLVLARSLAGDNGDSDDAVLERFETELAVHRAVAQGFFDRVLPQASA